MHRNIYSSVIANGSAIPWTPQNIPYFILRLRSPLNNVIGSGPQGKVLADEFMRLYSFATPSIHLVQTNTIVSAI